MGASTPMQLLVLGTMAHGFTGTASLALYLYTPEVYPTRMRALGTSTSSAWLRIASTIGPFIVGMIVASYHVKWAFFMFGLVALAGAFIALFSVETRDRILEELSP